MVDVEGTYGPQKSNECPLCEDVGYICRDCRRPEDLCDCDEPDIVPCPQCAA